MNDLIRSWMMTNYHEYFDSDGCLQITQLAIDAINVFNPEDEGIAFDVALFTNLTQSKF